MGQAWLDPPLGVGARPPSNQDVLITQTVLFMFTCLRVRHLPPHRNAHPQGRGQALEGGSAGPSVPPGLACARVGLLTPLPP